jgi:hypothetical protein
MKRNMMKWNKKWCKLITEDKNKTNCMKKIIKNWNSYIMAIIMKKLNSKQQPIRIWSNRKRKIGIKLCRIVLEFKSNSSQELIQGKNNNFKKA